MIVSMLRHWFACSCIALLLLAGCGGAEKIELGPYRSVLTLPGAELPFGLELLEENGAVVAYLVNGPERVRVTDVRIDGRKLSMTMPAFGNRLTARLRRGRLVGEVVLVKAGGKEQMIPFEAEHGATWRFSREPSTDNADVSGRWAVTFADPSGKQKGAVGEFEQTHHEVTGTFLLSTGDHRYLAGEMKGDQLWLSAFDGGHAYLYRARVRQDGSLEGDFWSGLVWSEKWTARRDEMAAIEDPDSITTARDETWSLGFAFPDENGKPVSMADQRYRNKVVLVTLAGSWCPNCHDEAEFLAPLYREYRDRGLEVIALMFEHHGEFDAAAQAVKGFREKFGIEYATLIAGISDKEDAARKLPQLNGVFAFPTTLFLDRRGRIQRIHTGFSGPATGEHHEALRRSFTGQIEKLLAQRGARNDELADSGTAHDTEPGALQPAR